MIVIVMGVCGSGKSTIGEGFARRMGWQWADADSFHPASNVAKMSQGIPLSEQDRIPWLDAMAEQIRCWREMGTDAVLGCSALTADARRRLGTDASDVKLVFLRGDKALIRSRMELRKNHFMPPELIDSQFATLEAPVDAIELDIRHSPQTLIESLVGQFAGA